MGAPERAKFYLSPGTPFELDAPQPRRFTGRNTTPDMTGKEPTP